MATEREIRQAIENADRVLAAAATGVPHVRPTAPAPPAAQVELSPEQVAAWSRELGFAQSAASGRVTRANDG